MQCMHIRRFLTTVGCMLAVIKRLSNFASMLAFTLVCDTTVVFVIRLDQISSLFCWYFYWCSGFYHRTGSDLFPFLLLQVDNSSQILKANSRKNRDIFRVKMPEMSPEIWENCSRQLTHKKVPNRDGTRCQ